MTTKGKPQSGPPPSANLLWASERANILLVDDQPDKLIAHEAILSDLGENIIKARSGREALEQLLKQEFAVILLDVKMPDMDGFEAAELIRQRPSLEKTPIIFLTGYSTSDLDRLKGYHLGAVDYLFLPIIPEVLKAKVQVFVDLAKQRQIIQKQAEILIRDNRAQEEQIRLIKELNDQLKSANEELESFSYSVSHDLRGPLRALEGYSHLLLEVYGGILGEEGQEYVRRIHKAALRMDDLIRDMLAYSRVSQGEIQVQPVDLNELLADLVAQQQPARDARARITVAPLLPKVMGHVACLSQCLANLLENAVKFVPAQRSPEVAVRSERAGQFVRLVVEDNGIGIERTFHHRIFRIFERVHEGEQYEGTGIGLAIVKKGVERMGGRVGFESEPGRGSKFWIDLPPADT